MADQFLGEIRAVSFEFAPYEWAFCNGQLMSISQNTALFSLLGTQYGGDGKTTFALPNLQGVVALGFGQGPGLSPYSIGETGGAEVVTLTVPEMAAHEHQLLAMNAPATATSPSAGVWAVGELSGHSMDLYAPSAVTQAAPAITYVGGGESHENRQPFLTLNYVIALTGIFPARG
jgi:microcystin-dependent protein